MRLIFYPFISIVSFLFVFSYNFNVLADTTVVPHECGLSSLEDVEKAAYNRDEGTFLFVKKIASLGVEIHELNLSKALCQSYRKVSAIIEIGTHIKSFYEPTLNMLLVVSRKEGMENYLTAITKASDGTYQEVFQKRLFYQDPGGLTAKPVWLLSSSSLAYKQAALYLVGKADVSNASTDPGTRLYKLDILNSNTFEQIASFITPHSSGSRVFIDNNNRVVTIGGKSPIKPYFKQLVLVCKTTSPTGPSCSELAADLPESEESSFKTGVFDGKNTYYYFYEFVGTGNTQRLIKYTLSEGHVQVPWSTKADGILLVSDPELSQNATTIALKSSYRDNVLGLLISEHN